MSALDCEYGMDLWRKHYAVLFAFISSLDPLLQVEMGEIPLNIHKLNLLMAFWIN